MKSLTLVFGITAKSNYGFNPHLDEFFKSKVFMFPMPGTPCKREVAAKAMCELKIALRK